MAHWADGKWKTITGTVTQVVERVITHSPLATETLLSFTPPIIEKYVPLSNEEKNSRRYRLYFSAVTTRARVGGVNHSLTTSISYTDTLGISRSFTVGDTFVSGSTKGNSLASVVNIWMKPGTTVTITAACNNGVVGTTAAQYDVNLVLEAI